ncbi:phosphatase PAP2 family protein [Roseburia hominis]|uniref:phosphatase PAP2 family protein n=1 Tax=Roseburia hominis TaxID=301301 RepID=UPI001F17BB86|nr:phosphatase PAP2 family protein [Roseburia hominis]MEE1248150.1 phosphatase PAP2 family protein [Lachnospiraceae bacterium]
MNKKSKKKFMIAGGLLFVFILFTVAVMKVDVAAIGPKDSLVGLSKINDFMFKKLGTHPIWDMITEVLLVTAFLIVLLFGVIGIKQLIERKSLWKVEHGILLLAVFYVFLAAFYELFEVVVVNYRPILEDGELAASFPSSHTMLICSIVGSAMVLFDRMLTNKVVRNVVEIIGGIILILAVMGRLLAGVHWFTDILGGVLLSAALVMFYDASVVYMDEIS